MPPKKISTKARTATRKSLRQEKLTFVKAKPIPQRQYELESKEKQSSIEPPSKRKKIKEEKDNKSSLHEEPILESAELKESDTLVQDEKSKTSLQSDLIQEALDPSNRADTITKLKAFDLDPLYGPCIGLSRRERWERAKKLNLNPPQEIGQLLDEIERRQQVNGIVDIDLREGLWHHIEVL